MARSTQASARRLTALMERVKSVVNDKPVRKHTWRRRLTKRIVIPKTSEQKKLENCKRRQRREDLADALDKSRSVMWEEARCLRERFGNHSQDYYFHAIMQTRKVKPPREITLWNAYLHRELPKYNDGKLSFVFNCFFMISTKNLRLQLYPKEFQGSRVLTQRRPPFALLGRNSSARIPRKS